MGNRFNSRDVAAVERLRRFLPNAVAASAKDAGVDPCAWWFERLMKARYDISQLNVVELLKLDYKEAEVTPNGARIGFSGVFVSETGFVERAGGQDAVAAAMTKFAES